MKNENKYSVISDRIKRMISKIWSPSPSRERAESTTSLQLTSSLQPQPCQSHSRRSGTSKTGTLIHHDLPSYVLHTDPLPDLCSDPFPALLPLPDPHPDNVTDPTYDLDTDSLSDLRTTNLTDLPETLVPHPCDLSRAFSDNDHLTLTTDSSHFTFFPCRKEQKEKFMFALLSCIRNQN